MLTRMGVCEHAEHVKSPQEYMKMVYDVTTNLCRNLGVHTKPLNGVSNRKNVSCGSKNLHTMTLTKAVIYL